MSSIVEQYLANLLADAAYVDFGSVASGQTLVGEKPLLDCNAPP
jgi:hypothetical protein